MIWIKDPECINLWYSSDNYGNKCEIEEHYNKNWRGFIYYIKHKNSLLIRGQSSTLEEAKKDCLSAYENLIKNFQDFVGQS